MRFPRTLVHNHDHLGQAIAYGHMIGVAPPWSTKDSNERR